MTGPIPLRVALGSTLRAVVVVTILLTAYYVVPVRPGSAVLTAVTSAALLVLVTLLLVFARSARRINRSHYPLIAGAESLIIVLAIFLVGFSFVYLVLSSSAPDTFSEPLSRSGALYFSVTVLSTVGFGDITPETDPSRLLVAGQMLIDIGLIAGALRLIFGMARKADRRQRALLTNHEQTGQAS